MPNIMTALKVLSVSIINVLSLWAYSALTARFELAGGIWDNVSTVSYYLIIFYFYIGAVSIIYILIKLLYNWKVKNALRGKNKV